MIFTFLTKKKLFLRDFMQKNLAKFYKNVILFIVFLFSEE